MMISNTLNIRKSINKAFLKVKPDQSQIESFNSNLSYYLDQIKESESEEFHKNIISDFLKNTYYGQDHYINTKGRTDLVIHNGKDSKSSVGVLIEAKNPSNKSEMPTVKNINSKAFHELVLYYLRERISDGNLEIKHLIATNNYEWFIFNSNEFEKLFAKNKKLVQQFNDFEEGRLSGKTTDFFYNDIISPFINQTESQISFTYFDLRDYTTMLSSEDSASLIPLFKIFSSEHLLKLPFINDSNTLDRSFYNELLHIIGLEEVKEKSKKIIRRKIGEDRDAGSLIENAITILNYEDCLSQIPNLRDYGEDKDAQLYNVALELVITWINRILFIKLLEGQLLRYHKGDPRFRFLDFKTISDYDELNKLFFHVLAVKEEERNEIVKKKYSQIPYLNSSLFEPNDLEHKTIRLSNLEDDYDIPIISSTVLKDNTGKRIKGEKQTLKYLLEFLDAYDFSSEGSEGIQEESKTLINASVLGLIFEKINGYKDGSFFTPGFITMYMCQETIRRAVVQRFNEVKGLKCESLDDLYNHIEDKKEANEIINSLKICDPAVGSGHFLVSALNEIIAIKSELKILADKNGKVLRDYHIEVVNDELVITDEDGEFFEYHLRNPESQRVQETLFNEKQTIIENCLFGVDINQNSVKICRLRLWIELLKNAYYKPDSDFTQLETLPNIDINIKCGNSLISRYPLDVDIKIALAKSKWSIDSYRLAVMTYRNAQNREEKAEMRRLIEEIKSDFESEVSKSDKRFLRLNKLKGELSNLTDQNSLFEMSHKEKSEWEKKVKKVTSNIDNLEKELDDIRNNKIYEHAFEWRFEFPEVLNDEGDYVGFDVMIGNPPYGVQFNSAEKQFLNQTYTMNEDIYTLFIERVISSSSQNTQIGLIIPIFWLTGDNYSKTRSFIASNCQLRKGVILPYDVFKDAYIDTGVFIFSKELELVKSHVFEFGPRENISLQQLLDTEYDVILKSDWNLPNDNRIVFNPFLRSLLKKINKLPFCIEENTESVRGILASAEDYSNERINKVYEPVFNGRIDRYSISFGNELYVKYGDNLKEKPGSFNYFEGERILVRRIISRQFRVLGTITKEKFVNKKDVYVFKSITQEFSNKLILAIINSKLISFLITRGKTSAKKDDFTQISLKDIREIRLPIVSGNELKEIEDLVDRIINMFQKSEGEGIIDLERELDHRVYNLYKLSKEEIQFIEESYL